MVGTIDFFPIVVEPVNWETGYNTLKAIRRRVFVEEQGVAPEEDQDGRDAHAIHWLARTPDGEPAGTGRLLGNRVGRMAVLPEYRGRGVGAAILRHIIQYAIDHEIDTLVLGAQIPAVEFYRKAGFGVDGDEFMDAGIPHLPMTLSLDRFIHRRPGPDLPEISEESRQRVHLDSPEKFCEFACLLAKNAERKISIFSQRLAPAIYDNPAFCDLVFQLVDRHPNAEILLLVREPEMLHQNPHRLVDLYHRLTSHIEIRRLNPECSTLHTDFMLCDNWGLLYNQRLDGFSGFGVRYAPVEVKELATEFASFWHNSQLDRELQRLHV